MPDLSSVLDIVSLIRVKRDNERALSEAEIGWLFRAYLAAEIADEQMAALLMAIYFNGLDGAELRAWTGEMIASGERLDLSAITRPTVDKHSTGGVGDKVSLILAPLLAACGVAVPMLSGRGLGHTGGTLDKLESIPGFQVNLDNSTMREILGHVGAVIAAAGDELAPADRKLYALRDVTGTVESIPLIASSIMSKKIAEGTQALVLDVKTGSGAFMRDRARAFQLAKTMVAIGGEHGVKTRAVITGMDSPLGCAVGNALEVEEAIQVMKGGGPADLIEVTLALAREALDLAGFAGVSGVTGSDPEVELALGSAYAVWERMVRAQGGDPDAPLPRAEHVEQALPAPRAGYLTRLDAMAVGVAAWRLGAGRARKEDAVDHAAGIRLLAKPGDHVEEGQPLVELHGNHHSRSAYAIEALREAVTVGNEPPAAAAAVIGHVGEHYVEPGHERAQGRP
jgi:thymidine phosphorylase